MQVDTTQKRTKLATGPADGMVTIDTVGHHKAINGCHSISDSCACDAGTVERRPTQVQQLTCSEYLLCATLCTAFLFNRFLAFRRRAPALIRVESPKGMQTLCHRLVQAPQRFSSHAEPACLSIVRRHVCIS